MSAAGSRQAMYSRPAAVVCRQHPVPQIGQPPVPMPSLDSADPADAPGEMESNCLGSRYSTGRRPEAAARALNVRGRDFRMIVPGTATCPLRRVPSGATPPVARVHPISAAAKRNGGVFREIQARPRAANDESAPADKPTDIFPTDERAAVTTRVAERGGSVAATCQSDPAATARAANRARLEATGASVTGAGRGPPAAGAPTGDAATAAAAGLV